ncbi:hypothetical protein [Rasiella sp. SM2506]|uniref:hypothetical protein n=1 Tax=Rasiella sp. SM2506 TaxID=3423914 RepID=UPI003D7AC9E1
MNSKWFIGVLIVALAFLGIRLEQTVVPNQEIVVQFHVDAVSANETENTIAIVTKQLKAIGVEGVQVTKTLDGNLKITYYSTIAVAVIKDVFSKQANVQLGPITYTSHDDTSNQPFDSNTATYELNVSEIHTVTDADMGLTGSLLEIKSGNEWYVNPVLLLGSANVDFNLKNTLEDLTYTLYGDVALGIDTTSYKIPEVRAGPLS